MDEKILEEIKESNKLLREQIEVLKQQNQILQQLHVFWSKIVSDEYFEEMIKNEGINIPK